MKKKSNELSLGDAIDLYLQSTGIKEKALVQRIIADWESIMGKPIADHTEKLWFNQGTFWIKVNHPVWKNELNMARTRIMDKLNQKLGASLIKEVKVI